MVKENNIKLIIWAVVALVIGVVIGLLLTNLVITGQAVNLNESKMVRSEIDPRFGTETFESTLNLKDPYLIYANKEIEDYIIQNNIDLSKGTIFRESTDGKLEKSSNIVFYPDTDYISEFNGIDITILNRATGENVTPKMRNCTIYNGSGRRSLRHQKWFRFWNWFR
ncbi:MAG: hypothetical protein WCX82_01955 [archaeon]|jgi:hypothetical protein